MTEKEMFIEEKEFDTLKENLLFFKFWIERKLLYF